ncbi:response regulator transcription factor [Pedococcus aerophilus]|uniref:response regulator transcription factor n=1 Tax=Pedococcus aerophilus TaxID=436356 RepID=UPI0031DBABC8
MAISLLVLEDDDGIRESLAMALESEGYTVTSHESAEDALGDAATTGVDLMLVDLMLGGMDGFEFIRQVRRRTDVPIIVLSARSDTHDIVAALEAGADDYVTKPFEIKEVGARLRALRRRPPVRPVEPEPLGDDADVVVVDSQHGPLVLDIGAGVLRRGESQVHLTVTEFRLLREMSDATGRVLSRRSLLERVWDRGYFGDERIVDVHVRRLRTKIETDPGEPRLLVTVRGLGYRLDTA